MKRLTDERDTVVRQAIQTYKRIVTDSGIETDDLGNEADFSLGFFMGHGLSFEEALEASEFVVSTGSGW